MSRFDDCISAIQKAAGGALTENDIEQIVSKVQRRKAQASQNPSLNEQQLAEQIGKELADAERLAALIEKRSQAINVLRKTQRFDWYSRFEGKEAQGLSILNVGSERKGEGFGQSVAAEQRAIEAGLTGPMLAELRAQGLDKLLISRDLDFEREIARNMWAITEGELAGKAASLTGRKEAQEAAKILTKYQEAARLKQNDAGAWIGKVSGYIVRQSHDMFRIRKAGFEAWRDNILPKLDDRTFDGVENRDEYLNKVWTGLATGEHYKERGADDWLMGFKGPGNLAKKASQERSLHFKSADDWFDYNQSFGASSLLEAQIFGLRKAGHNTALMRTWGTNPEAAFNADLSQLKQQAGKRGDAKTVDALNNWLIKSEFEQVDGTANIPGNPTWAQRMAGVRAVISMAKLGGSVLSSLPDIATAASTLRHQGIGLLESYGNSLQDFTRGRGDVQEREIADHIGVGLDGLLGGIMSRFSATDSVPGKMAKLQNRFFRFNLLSWWTDGKATGAGLIMSHNLARNAGKDFAKLDEALQFSLKRFNIGEKEWAAIRQADTRLAGDQAHLTPDAVQALPDNIIRPLAESDSPKAIQRARDDLEVSLRSFFSEEVGTAITMGGARERALVTWGTKAGTPVGEAVRFMMQFKMYPITFATRHMAREILNKDAVGIAHLIVATTALGYLSMQAKELTKGREIRKAETPGEWAQLMGAAMQQGGGLGIYGDFLFGQYNRFGGGFLESAAGPAAGTLSDLFRAFSEFKDAGTGKHTGVDLKQGGAALFKVGVNNAPFLNLFYTKAALDYLILYQMQETMNPGFLRRSERKMAQDNHQKYIIPPSSVIPFGGGSRLFEGARD